MTDSPASHRADEPSRRRRLFNALESNMMAATQLFRGPDTLDKALQLLNEQLGIDENAPDFSTGSSRAREAATVARPSENYARAIVYAPDMDGQADCGEIVWAPVQLNNAEEAPKERAVVVVGRQRQTLLGLLISQRKEHRNEPNWEPIGANSYSSEREPSWVRIDRVIEVPESGIRRGGAVMPQKRFEIIAARLREEHNWS